MFQNPATTKPGALDTDRETSAPFPRPKRIPDVSALFNNVYVSVEIEKIMKDSNSLEQGTPSRVRAEGENYFRSAILRYRLPRLQ